MSLLDLAAVVDLVSENQVPGAVKYLKGIPIQFSLSFVGRGMDGKGLWGESRGIDGPRDRRDFSPSSSSSFSPILYSRGISRMKKSSGSSEIGNFGPTAKKYISSCPFLYLEAFQKTR